MDIGQALEELGATGNALPRATQGRAGREGLYSPARRDGRAVAWGVEGAVRRPVRGGGHRRGG